MKSGRSRSNRSRIVWRSRMSACAWVYPDSFARSCRTARVDPFSPKNSRRMSLSMPTTSQPSAQRTETHSEPISPPDPVTIAFIQYAPLKTRSAYPSCQNAVQPLKFHLKICCHYGRVVLANSTPASLRNRNPRAIASSVSPWLPPRPVLMCDADQVRSSAPFFEDRLSPLISPSPHFPPFPTLHSSL